VSLAGVIAALSETSIAPAVKRAAEDLSAAFVAPEVDGGTADLASRQAAIVSRVESAIEVQSNALASAADAILARDPVVPVRFVPLSTPEAVLLYAEDFLPSWAGPSPSTFCLPCSSLFFPACIRRSAARKAPKWMPIM
jgi:hypothetical protein